MVIVSKKSIILFGLVFAMLAGMLGAAGSITIVLYNDTGVNNTDIWFSPYSSNWNDIINISVNITDSTGLGGGGSVIDVNATVSHATNGTVYGAYLLTNSTGGVVANNGTWNLTLNLSNVIWSNSSVITPTGFLITINATDSTGGNLASQNQTITIIGHDLGKMQGPPADAIGPGGINVSLCMREGSGTTNMSAITNFNATNFVMVTDLNGSAGCNPMGIGALPWGNTFQLMAMFNFTLVDMSTQEKATAVMMAMGGSIQVQIAPPRSYGTSRIYVNSSTVAALNTSATVTLYNLPFNSLPNITYDEGGSNGVSWNWTQGGWNATMGTRIGNLTIGIGNFSGYNISDAVAPIVQIVTPTNGSNYSSKNIHINVTGTGTDVQNITATITGDAGTYFNFVYLYNQSISTSGNSLNCTNTTHPGLDVIDCYLTNVSLLAVPGNYTLSVTAYDYGGTAGNTASNSTWFMNNTAPSVTNITLTNASNSHTTFASVTITDANGYQDIAFNLSAMINNTLNFTCTQWYNTTTTYTMSVVFNCTNATAFNLGMSTLGYTLNITVNDTYNNSVRSNDTTGGALPNQAPVSVTPTLSVSTLFDYTNLTCTAQDTDADGDPLNYWFAWYINGSLTRTVNGTTATDMLDSGNFTPNTNVTCQVHANDTVTVSSSANSTTLNVTASSYGNFNVNDTNNETTAAESMLFNDSAGAFYANLSIAARVRIDTPQTSDNRYPPGFISMSNYTATSGDLAAATAFGLNIRLGPAHTNFSSNVTLTINYSSLSAAKKTLLETMLAAGNITVKKCNDTGGACQDLRPQTYDTSADTITVNISGFSIIGLYDTTVPPTEGGTYTPSSGGSGGGSYVGAVAPSCTPNWKCTDWSSCKLTGESTAEGEKTRTCTDLNKCGVSTSKPSESMACTEGVEQPPTTPPETTSPAVTPPEEVPPTGTPGQQPGAQGITPTITPPTGTTGTTGEPEPGTDWTLIIGAIVVVVIIGVVGLGVLGGGGALYFLKKPKGLKGV